MNIDEKNQMGEQVFCEKNFQSKVSNEKIFKSKYIYVLLLKYNNAITQNWAILSY